MPRVYMHDSVNEHSERRAEILKGYFIGIVLILGGLFLLYGGIGFGVWIIVIGIFIFLMYKLVSNSHKKRYRYN